MTSTSTPSKYPYCSLQPITRPIRKQTFQARNMNYSISMTHLDSLLLIMCSLTNTKLAKVISLLILLQMPFLPILINWTSIQPNITILPSNSIINSSFFREYLIIYCCPISINSYNKIIILMNRIIMLVNRIIILVNRIIILVNRIIILVNRIIILVNRIIISLISLLPFKTVYKGNLKAVFLCLTTFPFPKQQKIQKKCNYYYNWTNLNNTKPRFCRNSKV